VITTSLQGRTAGAKNCIEVGTLRTNPLAYYEERYLPGGTEAQLAVNNRIGTIAKMGNLGWYEFERTT